MFTFTIFTFFHVIASLPQLTRLDNQEINQTERIQALQSFQQNHQQILFSEDEALQKRCEQKRKYQEKILKRGEINPNLDPDEDPYWNEKSEYTPESKKDDAEYKRLKAEQKNKPTNTTIQEPKREKRTPKLFDKDGEPLNCNEPKINFEQDEDQQYIKITVFTWKSLETNQIDVDLKEKYVKILIKGKVLQLVFWEDIIVAKSRCERAQATGHLTLILQKKNYNPKVKIVKKVVEKKKKQELVIDDDFDDMPELI